MHVVFNVKSWCNSAQRANVAEFCLLLSSLKNKKQMVLGRSVGDSASCSFSTRNDDKTDFPQPGSPDTQRRPEFWYCLHLLYFSCRRSQEQVPWTGHGT